jgi:hypothetical protein
MDLKEVGTTVLVVFALAGAAIALFDIVVHICLVYLLVENACISHARIELDPGRREHEVDMACELIAPEFDDASQVELADHVVRLDQGVHIGSKAVLCINAFLVELDLNEAVRVRANDEIHFGPVDHDYFLDVVNDVR